MGYTLVKEESLEAVAEAIRQKGGTADKLTFPDGFAAAILALESTPATPTPETPTTETQNLTLVQGYEFVKGYIDYIAVGHNSGHTNMDAVWSFTPSIHVSNAVFSFSWDNWCTGSNNGWSDTRNYVFAISTDGEDGAMSAATGTHIATKTEPLSEASGTTTVTFSGLSLVAGTTYYIRVNHEDATYATLKAFQSAGNTVQLTT